MKFNYKFRRLCGAYYGYPTSSVGGGGGDATTTRWNGSNIVYDKTGDQLVSAVLNRIQIVDLKTVTVRTLPVETRSNICVLALCEPLLVAVDVQGYALLINYHRGIVLHRFHASGKQQGNNSKSRAVRCIEFSPSGQYLAIGTGKHVQVWIMTPPNNMQSFAPLQLHRTYTGLNDTVTCLQWSPDETVIVGAGHDCCVRIWTVHTTRHFQPVTLQGHKTAIVGVYLGTIQNDNNRIQTLYTVSADGAAVTWECTYHDDDEDKDLQIQQAMMDTEDEDENEAVNFFTGGGAAPPQQEQQTTCGESTSLSSSSSAHQLVKTKQWSVKNRHYFHQEGGGGGVTVTSTSYCSKAQLLAVGFSSGIFGLYEMPQLANIHTLSVGSNQLVQACTLNPTGDWLALACPKSQQLLVWEWRSETYVLKQRGHAYGMRCMAYSPDAVCVATGGEDGKLKLWNAVTGFCYVTFSEKTHTAPVTGIAFCNASVVVTASLDGTVKAHDLHRYRTFKTLTTPTPVQFLSLAVDSAGEIVVAGSTDLFHIYAWNFQTGKLLDILSGHAGPVCDLSFQQGTGVLVSASWDGTVKTWDLYKGVSVPTESFQHSTDVVCVAVRPDGKQICTGTIGGLLSFWSVGADGKLLFEIDGRRDIAGGRKINDRMTSNNNAASRYFTSVCYSADGACVLAGGNSRYVCIYEVSQQILLKKFQVSYNRSLDGVLDEVRLKQLRIE